MRAAALAAAVLVVSAEVPPLPEGNAYVRSLVDKQRHREELLDRYTYDVEAVRDDLDESGRVRESHRKRYEVFYVMGRPVRRLVEEDGRPLSARQQEKADREARETAEAVRSGQAAFERPGLRLSAILDRYEFTSVRREEVGGRPAIVLEFAPRPGDRKIDYDRLLRRVKGRLWVDEAEEEIVRAELENFASLKFGWGLAGSVSELSTRIEFRKVDDTVWLPAEDETTAAGRILVVKKFRMRFRQTYSGYRHFSVESEETPHPLASPSLVPSPPLVPSPSPTPSPSF
jgi:hypothetical protein